MNLDTVIDRYLEGYDVPIVDLIEAVRLCQNLLRAIRNHRDQRGDDRCWMDDQVLYKALPEGYEPRKEETCVMLEHCKDYILQRQGADKYVSPQRKIEELKHRLEQSWTLITEVNWNNQSIKWVANAIILKAKTNVQ